MSRRFVYFQGEGEILTYSIGLTYTFGPTGRNNNSADIARSRLTQSSSIGGVLTAPNNNVIQPATLTNGAALQLSGEAEANYDDTPALRMVGSLFQQVGTDVTNTLQTTFTMTGTLENIGTIYNGGHRMTLVITAFRVSNINPTQNQSSIILSASLGINATQPPYEIFGLDPLEFSENIPIDITTIFPGDF
jgi:hypothetical protein